MRRRRRADWERKLIKREQRRIRVRTKRKIGMWTKPEKV
jgi:hypothetical protein